MTLLRKLFGPGMKDFYVNYYFNRTHRNYFKIGKHVMPKVRCIRLQLLWNWIHILVYSQT